MTITNEKRTTTINGTTAATTRSTSTHARAREEDVNIALEEIAELYQDVLGRPIPRFLLKQLSLDILVGNQPEWYIFALKEAAAAPQPSWRYVEAIVRRLQCKAFGWNDL